MLRSLIRSQLSLSRALYHSKVVASSAEAIKDIPDGASLAVGGFGLCGIPLNLIYSLNKQGTKDLTIISNNPGSYDQGLGRLLLDHQVKKLIVTYLGGNRHASDLYMSGELEIEFTPQGSLAERLRAGAAGIPAFYTATAYATQVQQGTFPAKYKPGGHGIEKYCTPKEVREFDGKHYVMEKAIRPDYALVKAWKADTLGNALFRKTARNFNPDMAAAGKICILEAEEIVEPGQLDPDSIHLPHLFVDRVVKVEDTQKPITFRIVNSGKGFKVPGKTPAQEHLRQTIAERAAREIKDGMNVNLGVGIPTLAANFINPDFTVFLESENGLLGMGPYPHEEEVDADLVNAGKETITAVQGASYFSSSDSFRMIRGGHLDITILGGMQVDEAGDLANWVIPGKFAQGMGGAMDLVASPSRVIVTMEHKNKKGVSKFVKHCDLPLTGKHVVDTLITEMGYFTFEKGGPVLREIAKGVSLEDLRAATDARFTVADDLKIMNQ